MADGGSALSPAVVHSTEPRAVRKQTIGRGLIALVWAIADVALIVLGRSGGTGERAGDEPFIGVGVSALVGAVVLCGLAVVNFRSAGAVADRVGQARRLIQARLIGWLCAIRLVAVIPALVALRSLAPAKDRIAQVTVLDLVMLALLDAAVALGIAAGTAAAVRRSRQPAAPPP